jgi:hypothetical protein
MGEGARHDQLTNAAALRSFGGRAASSVSSIHGQCPLYRIREIYRTRETFEFIAFFGQRLAFFGQRFPFFGEPPVALVSFVLWDSVRALRRSFRFEP